MAMKNISFLVIIWIMGSSVLADMPELNFIFPLLLDGVFFYIYIYIDFDVISGG